jgi:hypothetical protein
MPSGGLRMQSDLQSITASVLNESAQAKGINVGIAIHR